QRLLSSLPDSVQPIVFPPITARPDQMVSSELIRAILQCKGLIYLMGGASERSFWVALERDYALRSGKLVYSFDPATVAISRDTSKPLDLQVFISYTRLDLQMAEIVDRVGTFMWKERHFEVFRDVYLPQGEDPKRAIGQTMQKALTKGGYVLLFWSHGRSVA